MRYTNKRRAQMNFFNAMDILGLSMSVNPLGGGGFTLIMNYRILTFSASRPFLPFCMSKDTRWPSLRVL